MSLVFLGSVMFSAFSCTLAIELARRPKTDYSSQRTELRWAHVLPEAKWRSYLGRQQRQRLVRCNHQLPAPNFWSSFTRSCSKSLRTSFAPLAARMCGQMERRWRCRWLWAWWLQVTGAISQWPARRRINTCGYSSSSLRMCRCVPGNRALISLALLILLSRSPRTYGQSVTKTRRTAGFLMRWHRDL